MAGAAARDVQREFLDAFESQDPHRLMAMMSPELRARIDPPILAALMQTTREKLGRITDVTQTRFNVRANSQTLKESTATLTFEKGTGTSDIQLVDDKLTFFEIKSPQLADWFSGPKTTEFYEKIGEDFLRNLMANKSDAAWEMCHDALKDTLSRKDFARMCVKAAEQSNGAISMDVTEATMEQSDVLRIKYDIETQKAGTMKGSIKIEFVGMRGHLLGFNLE